jgi:hypothetical protein
VRNLLGILELNGIQVSNRSRRGGRDETRDEIPTFRLLVIANRDVIFGQVMSIIYMVSMRPFTGERDGDGDDGKYNAEATNGR